MAVTWGQIFQSGLGVRSYPARSQEEVEWMV